MSSGRYSVPFGKVEGIRFGIEGREDIELLDVLGRLAVAWLNAEGGEIPVHLRADRSRAVAVESVAALHREADRVRVYLVDRVDPPISETELQVRASAAEEGSILRLVLTPAPEQKPYAWLGPQGGREFLVRSGTGARIMARDEIARVFGASEVARIDPTAEAIRRLLAERDALAELGEPTLWIRIEPLRDLALDLSDPHLEDVLADPKASGNRNVGFHFAIADHPVIREDDRLRTCSGAPHGVVVEKHGGLTFQGPLSLLRDRSDRPEIHQLALLEYPVSALRMAREILRPALRPGDRLLADLALLGLRNYQLSTGLPVPRHSRFYESRTFEAGEDLVWPRPLYLRSEELLEQPDRCGFRLIERVYEAFGYTRGSFPPQLREGSGRLVLPD